ncbi:hypothetical protein AB0O75_06675 [Streptomyces sp. NPDC088921]
MWSVLTCPLPEAMRNVRYELQTQLTWTGFGAVQPPT